MTTETQDKPLYRPRIYVHAPFRPAEPQALLKKIVLEHIRKLGFDPQEFQVSGLPRGDSFTLARAVEVMRQCDGALILALSRKADSGRGSTGAPSEYAHFEGALALASGLPTIVIAEEGMGRRGILSASSAASLAIPMSDLEGWVGQEQLVREPPFERWVSRVRERYDVFFGYCSKADRVAQNMKAYLTEEAGMRVLDWATDFRAGRTIMHEIDRASATCRCALFLFTVDDPIEGSATQTVVPRDNVLLEAGYFMNARGAKRVVVVREKGTKMPADLGGLIYLRLERRNAWRQTAQQVAHELRLQMSEGS